MSPIPPVTEFMNDLNGSSQVDNNQNFNQTKQVSTNPACQPQMPCNGTTEPHQKEVEPVRTKRGRPPKTEGDRPSPNGAVKKRGRPPKTKTEDVPSKQSKITDTMKKAKRTVNRFKDVTKEELLARFLPDRIKPDLDILIIGINPGLFAVYKGHHYAGPGNHFWKCLYLSGLIPTPLTGMQDYLGLDYGIGLTNIVERTTPGSKDLSSKEIREGAKKLIEKIQQYKPKIAVFNGKGIYEIFSKEIFGQKKKDFTFGTQEKRIPGTDTYIYVMPSSSARCAQFPRAQDKVHFYIKLKHLRDSLRGVKVDEPVCEVAYSFDLEKATELAKVQNIKQEKFDPDYEPYDWTKNGLNNSFPAYAGAETAGASSGQELTVAKTANLPNASTSDVNNNLFAGVKQTPPQTSGATTQATNNNNNSHSPTPGPLGNNDKKDNDVAMKHSHLIRYLRQEHDSSQEPGPSHGRKSAQGSTTLSPANPKLQQDVSEEQRQERVGNWVREQQCLEYDSEPPMGIEETGSASGGQDGGSAAGVEIDRASQLSAISAGVSGSASESTSGYGSVDASSRRVRLDRVEMWVLEQQHVRRHNPTNLHLQQSIQAASSASTTAAPGPSIPARVDAHHGMPRFQHAPTVGWLHSGVLSPMGVMHTPVTGVAAAPGARKPPSSSAMQVNMTLDQGAGTSATPTSNPSGGRNSPYRLTRTGTLSRREGGSGSSFGTTVRPPVPLYSSWGGEGSGSGGSGVSSPVVPFVTNPSTPPNLTQSLNPNVNHNNNTTSQPFTPNLPVTMGMAWQSMATNSVLAPFYNL